MRNQFCTLPSIFSERIKSHWTRPFVGWILPGVGLARTSQSSTIISQSTVLLSVTMSKQQQPDAKCVTKYCRKQLVGRLWRLRCIYVTESGISVFFFLREAHVTYYRRACYSLLTRCLAGGLPSRENTSKNQTKACSMSSEGSSNQKAKFFDVDSTSPNMMRRKHIL